MNMDFKRKLPIPMETKEMYPLTVALPWACDMYSAAKHKNTAAANFKTNLIPLFNPTFWKTCTKF